MPPAARVGDMTVHGGVIMPPGCPTVLIGGMPAARLSDMHTCPMTTGPVPHVGGPIVGPGAPTVLIGGMPAAVVGDMVTCTGPPDSIAPPGCPTVMISSGGGGGGGGGAGGGGGGSGEGESGAVEQEKGHFLNVKFTDKAGKPITGVSYSVKSPDNKVVSGTLAGQIKKGGVPEGNYEVTLKAITKAEWSAKEARVGETVKLKAEISGFASGTKAIFQIFEKDFNSADDLIATIEGQTSGDKVEVDWEYQYVEDTDDVQTEQDKKLGYSLPEYYFIVRIEKATARSPLLRFKDYVEIYLKDHNGNPVPNAAYRLYFANGQILEGTLDSNGYKKVEKVPPGEWSVSFPGQGSVTQAST